MGDGQQVRLVRRQLGRRLRQLRERAGKSPADVQSAKIASPTKLWRIETGAAPTREADARMLCHFYGADAQTTDDLAQLAFHSDREGWWEEYKDALPREFQFGMYVGIEALASAIRTYEPELVHGLLQTEDYARAAIRATAPGAPDEVNETRVKLRMERKHTKVFGDPPVELIAVLNEGCLHRMVGGPAVLAEQVRALCSLAERDNVDIRVLPWAAGNHAAVLGQFTVLDLIDPQDPAVVYIETHAGAHYLEKPRELQRYRGIFRAIYDRSVPIKEHAR